MPSLSVKDRLADLLRHINSGQIIPAMNEFYDANVRMQENALQPIEGLPGNIEREKLFLASVKEWKSFNVLATAVNGDVSFCENVIEYIAIDGSHVKQHQVSVARWRNGKIIHERFYYDPAGAAPTAL